MELFARIAAYAIAALILLWFLGQLGIIPAR